MDKRSKGKRKTGTSTRPASRWRAALAAHSDAFSILAAAIVTSTVALLIALWAKKEDAPPKSPTVAATSSSPVTIINNNSSKSSGNNQTTHDEHRDRVADAQKANTDAEIGRRKRLIETETEKYRNRKMPFTQKGFATAYATTRKSTDPSDWSQFRRQVRYTTFENWHCRLIKSISDSKDPSQMIAVLVSSQPRVEAGCALPDGHDATVYRAYAKAKNPEKTVDAKEAGDVDALLIVRGKCEQVFEDGTVYFRDCEFKPEEPTPETPAPDPPAARQPAKPSGTQGA